ncbi:MAG: chemotaxis-specific protein-glutamate methyltransferase CheB [bacterium]|nr:chemotaxis-specific protein-glutamate methyltransferase CheB [bacterium]
MSFRVLLVDDSRLTRRIVADTLAELPGLEVAGEAANGRECLEILALQKVDLVIMDVEMPELDGIATLKEISVRIPPERRPAVLMLSVLTQHGALTTFRALDLGALDFVPKPSANTGLDLEAIKLLLHGKVREIMQSVADRGALARKLVPSAAGSAPASASQNSLQDTIPGSAVEIRGPQTKPTPGGYEMFVIGCSTGGPQALQEIFRALPGDFPVPILIVQHMPPFFTAAFADRLNGLGPITVVEAISGMPLKPGHAYLAPGDRHMLVRKNGNEYLTVLNEDPPLRAHRPAIDKTLLSAVEAAGKRVGALIMTGMGRDGVEGMEALAGVGGLTLAQDEASSVVFGMNRRAIEAGAIYRVVELKNVVEVLSVYFP